MSDIQNQIDAALRVSESAVFAFSYKGEKDKEPKIRVIKFVNDVGKQMITNGADIKSKGAWTSGSGERFLVEKNGEHYVRGFPTADDANGAAAIPKVFKISGIENFTPFVSPDAN